MSEKTELLQRMSDDVFEMDDEDIIPACEEYINDGYEALDGIMEGLVDGMSRAEAARAAGMDRQALRDWVIRFNAEGIAGLCDRKRSGPKPFLDDGQQAVLRAMVLRGPDPDRDGVSAWRLIDICRLCEERFGVAYSVSGMFDLLKGLDLSWQKSRPRHPQADAAAQKAFKKGGSPKP